MSTCPFCNQPVTDAEADQCSACGQTFLPPDLGAYQAPVESLDDLLYDAETRQLDVRSAQEMYMHAMGAVQQVLDQARDDLQVNLRKAQAALQGLPDEARVSVLEVTQMFGELQARINERMLTVRGIVSNARTVQDIERQMPLMNHCMAQLKADLQELEALKLNTSHPQLHVVADEPVPEEATRALEHVDQAMQAMQLYLAGRETEDLEQALAQITESQRLLKLLVMKEAYGH